MGLLRRCRTAWSRHHRSAGFGIHSPHAYRFVTEVLGERCRYYAYDDIAALRRAVIAATDSRWPHPRILSERNARLLFRITNHFNPGCILQVGTCTGVTSAVMLAVSSQSRLWLYEPGLASGAAASRVLQPLAGRVCLGTELAPIAAAYSQALDGAEPFVLVNHVNSDQDADTLSGVLSAMCAGKAVLLMRHLATDKRVNVLWQACCRQLVNGQTFTNSRWGILIANPKLQREHFDLWL
ncbi:MAG: hypothetical protein IJT30_00665 [Muribaculaceae bacterium]|nr:hypothetical protein [Muribaculaceae bacterium]